MEQSRTGISGLVYINQLVQETSTASLRYKDGILHGLMSATPMVVFFLRGQVWTVTVALFQLSRLKPTVKFISHGCGSMLTSLLGLSATRDCSLLRVSAILFIFYILCIYIYAIFLFTYFAI